MANNPSKSLIEKLLDSVLLKVIERLLILTALLAFIFDLNDRSSDRVTTAFTAISSKISGPSQKKEALEFLNSHSCWRFWDNLPGCSWFTLKKRQSFLYIDLGPAKRPNVSGIGNGTYGVHLQNAQLAGARFTEAYIENGYFQDANLKHASFSAANLEKAHFYNANLEHSIFDSANLMFAGFSKANINHSRFRKACLIGANMGKVDFANVDLDKAVVSYSLIDKNALSEEQKKQVIGLDKVFTDPINYYKYRKQHKKLIQGEKSECWNNTLHN